MCAPCARNPENNDYKQRQSQAPEINLKERDSTSDIEGRPSNSNGPTPSDSEVSSTGKSKDLSTYDTLFEDLAKFMKELPAKSKKHIWEHAVIEKDKKGKVKTVFDKASKQEQITRLLCDCVIVYIKYLNRKEKPLKTQAVLPYAEPAAKWIFEKYHELDRQRFEQESKYFPEMLEEYQHFVK